MTDAVAGQAPNGAGEQGSADGQPTNPGTSTLLDSNQPVEQKTEATPAEKAPEPEVDYSFEMPEGMELDAKSVDEFKALAKDLKMPKDAAQKLVDIAVAREQARIEAHAKTVAEWADSVKADKEIGGDKLGENLAIARKAIDLGPPELKELLNASGLGNHPVVVKWALSIGKALSEDKFVPAGQPAEQNGDMASRLYSTKS